MVRWTRSTQPLVCGRPTDEQRPGVQALDRPRELG
jgi:hypothetical protein